MQRKKESHWPQLEGSVAKIVRGLFRARNFIWDQDHRIVDEYGLTWGQFDTLVSLRSAPPPFCLSPTELYQAVQVTSGGLTKILNGLERKYLIERLDNPNDGRSRLVQITDEGCALVEGIINHLIETNRSLLGKSLTDKEIDTLARLLDKILSALEA